MKHPRGNAWSRLLLLPIKKSKQLVSSLSGSGHGVSKQQTSSNPSAITAQSNPNNVYTRQNAIRSCRALDYLGNFESAAQELPQILDPLSDSSSHGHGEMEKTQEITPDADKEIVTLVSGKPQEGEPHHGDDVDEGDDIFEANILSISSLEVSSNSDDEFPCKMSSIGYGKQRHQRHLSAIPCHGRDYKIQDNFLFKTSTEHHDDLLSVEEENSSNGSGFKISKFSENSPVKSFLANGTVMQDPVSKISNYGDATEHQNSPCTPKYRHVRDSDLRTPNSVASKQKNIGLSHSHNNVMAKLAASNMSYSHGVYSDKDKVRSASKISNTKNGSMSKHARSFSHIPLQNISNGQGLFGTASATPPRLFRELNSNTIPNTNDNSNVQACKSASGKNQNKQVVWREGLLQRLGKLHDSGKCRMSLEELIDLDDNKNLLGDLETTPQQMSSPKWKWRSSDKSETHLPSPLQCTSHTNSLFERQHESFNSAECR